MVGLLKIKQSSKIDAHGSSSVLFGHVPRFSRAPFDYNQRTPRIQIPARFNLLQTLHCTQLSIAVSWKINNNTSNSIFYSFKAGWWFGTCFIFPYVRNNNPKWLYDIFRRGRLKPPTRKPCIPADVPFTAGQDMFQSTAAMNSFNSWVTVASRTWPSHLDGLPSGNLT